MPGTGFGDPAVQPAPAGAEGGFQKPNNPFAKTAEELAALEDFTVQGYTGDLEHDRSMMNKQFTQTQQALKQKIRDYEDAMGGIEELQRKAAERDWLAQQPSVVKAAMAAIDGGTGQEPNPATHAGQASGGDDIMSQYGDMDPAMMTAADFQRVLKDVATRAATDAVAAARQASEQAISQNVVPLMEQLVNREGQRTTAERDAQFMQMRQMYPDFQQVEADVQAKMKAYPGMPVTEAYRVVGSGVTAAQAAAQGLSPNGAGNPELQKELRGKSFREVADVLKKNESQLQSMGPVPGGLAVPGAQVHM